MTNFDKAFEYTVGNEGSYSNDRFDSGGPTKFGITQRDLSVWLHRSASIQEVKDMTLETAKAIYLAHYWSPLSLDQITNSGIATCLFDIGVVRGIGVPPKYAQMICNSHGAGLVVDGHVGPKTIAAINSLDPHSFISDFSTIALSGFRAIVARNPTQGKFLKGWSRRATRLLTLA